MLPLFEGNLPLAQLCGIFFLDLPLVAQEHIITFYFGQNGGSYATFGSAQYNYSRHIFLPYL